MSRPLADRDEILRAIHFFAGGSSTIELRAVGCLRGDGIVAGYYRNFEGAADHAALLTDGGWYKDPKTGDRTHLRPAESVYITLNPPPAALYARRADRLEPYAKETTADRDITHRRLLLMDADPSRFAKIGSSDDEHEEAIRFLKAVIARLRGEFGLPCPAFVDSGNGAHALWGIDLPNTEEVTRLVERFLKACAHLFDTEGTKIDQSVFNAARLVKTYGTVSRKGDDVPERPHRTARLLHVPKTLEIVSVEQLEAVAALLPEPEAPGKTRPGFFGMYGSYRGDLGTFPMEEFLRRNTLLARGKTPVSKPYGGGTRWQIDCPFNADHQSPDASVFVTGDGAPGFKCLHNSCAGKDFRDVAELLKDAETLARYAPKNSQSVKQTTDKNDKNPSDAVSVVFVSNPFEESPDFDDPPGSLSVDLLPVPSLSPGLLPDALRPWCMDIATRVSCPLEYVAAAALVSLSAAVGRRVTIRPKRYDEWTVVPNLWGAVVGPPGALKSPAVKEALRPLHRLEVEAKDAYDNALAQYECELEVNRVQAKASKDRLQQAAKDGKSRDALLELAKAASAEMGEPPVWTRYVVNDATVEKLGELLKENPNGLLQERDELTGFFRSLEKQGREGDRAFYLEAWNGDNAFTYDRIGRGTVVIPSVCLSLFGTIQPGPLARYLRGANGGEDNDGLGQRLQILVYPDPPRSFTNVDRWPHTDAKNHAYGVYKRLAGLTAEAVGAEREDIDGLPYLRFTASAQTEFDAWRESLENRLLTGGLTPLMQSHLSKYRSLLPSLALLFHLADDGAGPVTITALERAIAWCAFLEAHARRIYQSVQDGDPDGALRLAERVKQSLPNPFTFRDVYRKGWAGLSEPDDVERAVALLEDRGWVKTIERKSDDAQGRGRPTTWVFIHPLLVREERDGGETPRTAISAETFTQEVRTSLLHSATPDPDAPEVVE